MKAPCCFSPQEDRLRHIIAGDYANTRPAERKRVLALLSRFESTRPVIDIERARLFTESMRQSEGQPLVLRWARAMYHIAGHITVYISEDQLLAGRAGARGRHGILFPEIDGDFYPEFIANIDGREQCPFDISKEDARVLLEEVAPYWTGKTFHEHLNNAFDSELHKLTYLDGKGLHSRYLVNEAASYRSALQWVHDFEKVLRKGINGIRAEVEERLASLDPMSPIDRVDKRPFLEAMLLVCDAVVLWANRHAVLARAQAAACRDADRKEELLRLADICENVPANPPRSFYEAVQSQWFIQIFSRLEQKTSAVISNGRMDQYFYPYYRKDKDEGRLSDEEAMELLECMWMEMAQYIDMYVSPNGNAFNEGYAHWEAVTIGGQTREGFDATNELSYLFLQSKRELPLNYPDLAARIHSRSPERFVHEVAETIKEGSGFPKLINDEEVIPLMISKGAYFTEAYDYAVSGCSEARLVNRETYTSGCNYINFTAALEMVLYRGRMAKYGDEQLGPDTGDPLAFTSWRDFWDAYVTQHLYLLSNAFAQQYIVDKLRPRHFSSPLGSLLHDVCMKECKDLHSEKIPGGLDIAHFEFIGYGTLVDSLAAVKHAVFDTKSVAMPDLITALHGNFENAEPLRKILQRAPKYGNNMAYADDIGRDLDTISLEYTERYSRERGVNYDLRMVPITANVPFGKVVGATPNGRKAWTALSDGASASHGADTNGPTAVLLSNYASKNYQFNRRASRLLNIKLSPKCVDGEEGTRKLVSFIRAFCDLKLWHLQFNIINRQTLLAAQAEPEKYKSLLVRVAGYSAYFVDLSKDLQADLIDRTEHAVM